MPPRPLFDRRRMREAERETKTKRQKKKEKKKLTQVPLKARKKEEEKPNPILNLPCELLKERKIPLPRRAGVKLERRETGDFVQTKKSCFYFKGKKEKNIYLSPFSLSLSPPLSHSHQNSLSSFTRPTCSRSRTRSRSRSRLPGSSSAAPASARACAHQTACSS